MKEVINLNRMLKSLDERMRFWAVDKIIFKIANKTIIILGISRNII